MTYLHVSSLHEAKQIRCLLIQGHVKKTTSQQTQGGHQVIVQDDEQAQYKGEALVGEGAGGKGGGGKMGLKTNVPELKSMQRSHLIHIWPRVS